MCAGLRGEVGLKDSRQMRIADAAARIGYLDEGQTGAGAGCRVAGCADRERAAVPHRFDGVGDNLGERSAQVCVRALDEQGCVGDAVCEPDSRL